MAFCQECGAVTEYDYDLGHAVHPPGATCSLAVEPESARKRRAMILEEVNLRGERFVVTTGEWTVDGRKQQRLVAVRDGRFYALDFTCIALVRENHAYRGVVLDAGMGEVPRFVSPEEAREGFFAALDPRVAEPVPAWQVVVERVAPRLRESPLVFEVRNDRDNPGNLIAVLKVGTVTRVHKHGETRASRGPFYLDGQQESVAEPGVYVGVPGNARFTHVVLDLASRERAERMLREGRYLLAQKVATWDLERRPLVEKTVARLTAEA